MHTLSQLLFLLFLAIARPALAATTCQPFTTFIAKFDKLPTATPVPSGFGSVSWNSFTVEPASSFSLTPQSAPNVAIAPAQGASITQLNGGYGDYTEAFAISSFYFACAAYSGGYAAPVDCTLQVVGQTMDRDVQIQDLGSFAYSAQGGGMVKVEVDAAAGGFYLGLVGGQGNAFLLVDSVVVVDFNPKCPE